MFLKLTLIFTPAICLVLMISFYPSNLLIVGNRYQISASNFLVISYFIILFQCLCFLLKGELSYFKSNYLAFFLTLANLLFFSSIVYLLSFLPYDWIHAPRFFVSENASKYMPASLLRPRVSFAIICIFFCFNLFLILRCLLAPGKLLDFTRS